MQQYSEALSFPSELRNTLTQLMVGATFTEETLRDDCLSVLLMMRGHAVTAFAVGNGTDYERQYEAFKKHYLKRSSEWSAKDVSFVYCIPANITVLESFRSSIEVDVYFCRKYVVQLDQDLVTSLARLPFLPLSPITPGVQIRPPSAQKLLQQRKLKAELARALVVPAKRSPSAILGACLEGAYGAPDKLEGALTETSSEPSAEERVQTTLRSISIENFRAYRTKKTFEFGAAITVLYGPNGFGKTSFFDAIDFVVTGGVGRLAKASGGLAKAAKHLDSSGNESTTVTLTLERDGQPHVITRNLADHNNAEVDGKVTSRKDVLSLLTGGVTASANRVGNMVDLFRATHLFSQDRQELTQDVAVKCELPADIVSRMLAFEDYVSGLKKAEEVLKIARQTLAEARMQAQNARGVIESERKDLKRLEGLASVDTSPEALDARFTELAQAISTSGFNVSGISPRDTRALRAVLESFAAEAARLRAMVSKALEQVANLKTQHGQLESMRIQIEDRKVLVEQAEVSSHASSGRLGALTSELAQFKTQEQALKNRRDWWAWAVSVQPEYARLIAQSRALTEGLAALTQRLNQQKEARSKALNTQRDAAAALQRLEAALKTAGDSSSRARWVKEQAGLWVQAEPRVIVVQALEAKLQGSSATKSARLAEVQQVVLAQELLVARVERELSSARSNETTLKQLIAELRTHVDGATCLLCGHDHGTQGALLAEIDKRMAQGDLVVQLNETLATERGKLQTQLAARQVLTEELGQDEQQLGQAKTERESLERQRMAYEMALSSVGLSLSNDTAKQLEQMSSQMHEAEMLAASAVNGAQQLLDAANIALGRAQDDCQTLEREHQASTTALETVNRRLDEVLADANRGMVNLEISLQSLAEALQDADAGLAQTSSSVHTANNALDDQKAVNAAAKAALAAARTSHQQAVQTWSTCQANVQSLVAGLKAAGFDSNISDEQLRQRIQAATAREVLALGLRDRVAELEVAVDTAATSAAFQSIFDRILAAEKLVEQADERAQKVEPWVAYFEDVTKLLGSQQAVATAHFITEYGPRTAVIQQRLRPVYGFGEVEVSSKDSAISIRVHRKGKELRPTDYFSQSQVQTLVLGLFLTACSSQTWSGFSSIMMDDPVTHFDDLNTYALLDLILGLQNSREGERQFVISTCDEKLLQLARLKFRHLGDAAKFYRFSAIGAEGPMVNEIPA